MTTMKKILLALPAVLLAVPAYAECSRHGARCGNPRHPQVDMQRLEPTSYDSEAAALPISLPSDASVGDCFARVAVPATFETRTEQVVVREASERIEVIPAEYETITEQVLVRPESHDVIDVPPEFQTITEQVLVEPARSEWQYVDCGPASKRSACGPRSRVSSNASNKRLCLVEVPARYETISRTEMVRPPSTRTVVHPAQYKTITRQVVKTPARQVAVQVPAEYGTVTRQVLVADAGSEWQRVDCRSGALVASSDESPASVQASSSYRR